MTYLKALWKQQDASYPSLLYSELNEESFEVRKVEIFRDGSVGFAEKGTSVKTTQLGQVAVPGVDKINTSSEFTAVEIEQLEFELIWKVAIKAQKVN